MVRDARHARQGGGDLGWLRRFLGEAAARALCTQLSATGLTADSGDQPANWQKLVKTGKQDFYDLFHRTFCHSWMAPWEHLASKELWLSR